MFSCQLHRVEHTQHFVEVAASGHRIDQHQFDLLVRTDDEYGANRGIVGGGPAGARLASFSRQHRVKLGDFQVEIADNRIGRFVALRLLDVGGPLSVVRYGIDTEADDFAVPLGKFGVESRHVTEFGGEVLRVREKHAPGIANELVEADAALSGFNFEIGRHVVDSQDHTEFERI